MTILLWLTLSHSAVHTQGVTARLSLSLAGQGWTLEVAAAAAQLPPAPAPARRVSPVAVSGPRHSPTTAASGALLSRIPTQTCRYVYGYTGRRSSYM